MQDNNQYLTPETLAKLRDPGPLLFGDKTPEDLERRQEKQAHKTFLRERQWQVEIAQLGGWYVCLERYTGSGRISRSWVERDSEGAPDRIIFGGRQYPYNGMGGEVYSGPFWTRKQALMSETKLWADIEETS